MADFDSNSSVTYAMESFYQAMSTRNDLTRREAMDAMRYQLKLDSCVEACCVIWLCGCRRRQPGDAANPLKDGGRGRR